MDKKNEELEFELQEIPIDEVVVEEVATNAVDVTDIKNYYFQKTKKSFTDIVNYLYKQKLVLIIGVIFSFILIILYILLPTWRNMGWEAWFSVIVAEISVILLIGNVIPPAFVFLLATTACFFVGIITPSQALEGFSNTGIVTIGVLFIVAKTIEMSDVLKYVVKYVLRHPKSLLIAQVRLLIPVTALSGFINNTPLVALLIPVVHSWSNQCGFSASQLLLPLSYAAIIGGTCTLIGTSTNLIVYGLAQQRFPDFYLGFFEIAIVGIPNAIFSLAYMLIFTKYLLPNKKKDSQDSNSDGEVLREYTVSMIVTKNSNLVGKTVGSKGLLSLQGIKLFKIIRNTKAEEGEIQIDNIDESFMLLPGDTLFFQGLLDNISILYQLDGLVPATTQISKVKGKRKDRVLVEVVLAAHSPQINKTIRETRFRSLYNAVIVAVHRHGVNLAQKISDIELQLGDTLLLETTKEFITYHQNDSNFALVSEISRGETIAPRKISFSMIVTVLMGFLMVILSALQVLSLLQLAFTVACLYILFGFITWRQALACIQGETLLVIAAAFGLGNALQQSGAAGVISNSLVSVFSIGGRIGVIAGLFLTTGLLSSLISNGATVTLMFPIAVGFATSSGISIKAVCYTLMMAASCSYMTPVGFQTNLMVMGPGGYTPMDYIKFGFIITIIACLVTVSIVYLVWADGYNPAYYY